MEAGGHFYQKILIELKNNSKMSVNEISYDFQKAGRLVLLWSIPLTSSLIFLFYLVWHEELDFSKTLNIIQDKLYLSVLIFIISVVLHEAIHALAYLIFDNWQYKNLSFGLSKNLFSPYCHYSNSVLLWKYRLALLFPGLIMGLIPLIISFIIGNFYLLIYGIVFTLGAFGDFFILWKLRKYNFRTIVKDHPSMMGCIMEME